jgi:YD repeat-containing protein
MKRDISTELFQNLIVKLFFGIFFLSNFFCSYSQTINSQTGLPNVFPSNPKAFEFLKYTEIPVSKYTGVPNISVPIYTIKTDGLDIPIVLSYHSNGFKVSEEAGWTGLGWTLNAAGSIVQIVNGNDDFSTFFGNRSIELNQMLSASNVPSIVLNNMEAITFPVTHTGTAQFWPYRGKAIDFYEADNMLDGSKDTKPDVFKFNMIGYNGDFVLDWNDNKFKCLTDPNVKIEGYGGNSFRITTTDGNCFFFERKEESIISGNERFGMNNSYPVYWQNLIGEKTSRVYQLVSIYTNKGSVVNFNYIQTDLIDNYPNVNEFKNSYSFRPIDNVITTNLLAEQQFPNYPTNVVVSYSKQSFSYLSSINFPDGTIDFYSTSDRTDLIGARKLNRISVKNNRFQPIKSFTFNYDYFIGNSNGNNYDKYLQSTNLSYLNVSKTQNELTNRLKLLSVQEDNNPEYIFEYESQTLPKKTSLATDLWGLYNGKLNNTNLFPNFAMMGILDFDFEGIQNNKNSNLQFSKACLLNKIKYPTGGTSKFEYELNSFDNFKVPDDEHSTITSIFLNDRNNPGDQNAQVFMADAPSLLYGGQLNINTYGPLSSYTNGLSAYIRVSVLKKTASNIALVNNGTDFWPLYYTTALGQLSSRINDVVSDARILQFDFIQNEQRYETFKIDNNVTIQINPQYIYIIQAYLDPSFGPQTNVTMGANASAYFTFLKNAPHDISYGGGLRIKTIRTEDNNSTPIIKKFAYKGGKLMGNILHANKFDFEYHADNSYFIGDTWNPPSLETDCIVTKSEINSSSFIPLSSSASGNYVGYDTVREEHLIIDLNSGNLIENTNGAILDIYTNTPDFSSFDPRSYTNPTIKPTGDNVPQLNTVSYLFISAPARKANIENGLSKTTLVYDKNGSIIEETNNIWDFALPNTCIYGRMSFYAGNYSDILANDEMYNPLYRVGFYPMYSTKTLLSSTSTSSYQNGINKITITKNNHYDSYKQLTKTIQTDSKQNITSTYYKHSYDFSPFDDGITSSMWLTDNFILPVIETKVEKNSVILSTVRDYYARMGGGSTSVFYAKQKTKSAKGNFVLEDDIVFDLYGDENSIDKYKLRQYHDRSGITTSILWGYNGQYPVAKIIGKSYMDVINQSGINTTTLNGVTLTDAQMRTELAKLRQLTNCLVTTYTYAPLVGITSQSDANNRTTYYEYDGFNRLQHIRDDDNNILKKYCYNYAGQSIDCKPTNRPTIYAKLNYVYYPPEPWGGVYGNVVINFYSDEACTQPLSVSNLSLQYNYYFPCYESSNYSLTPITVAANGTSITLATNQLLQYWDSREINGESVPVLCNNSYAILNSDTYNIVR